MTIPAPLAFPPTALRNISAGLVVGNPVGSSGTRAKALTSAELKAIVEASGISYLPLSGGTLSGALGMPANQSIRWSESNDSRVTSPGTSTIDIYSGGFITRFSNGSVSAADWIGIGTDGNNPNVRLYHGGGNVIEQRNGLNAQCFDLFETYTSGTNNGKLRFKTSSAGHRVVSSRATSGANRPLLLGQEDAAGAFTGITVATTGLTTIYTPTDASFGLTLDSATMGFFYMRPAWDGSGVWHFGPSSNAYRVRFGGIAEWLVASGARTVTANSVMTFEMTSNTAGNLVYRGSDGTTRRMALTFS